MNAFDAVAYINAPTWQESRLGLDRISELLAGLGDPQTKLPFVHVAGTNGKGSTCAYTASILQAAGYRTGLFTSPYIIEFADRIRVDGCNITPGELEQVTLAARDVAEEMEDHPTEFELMTAVALLHFAQSDCDIAVLEVGLGGRLDSTNVIPAPAVCAITPIALDHTALLGDTVEAIATEKAGIIKAGSSVVSASQPPEARVAIEHAAAAAGCDLRFVEAEQALVEPTQALSAGVAGGSAQAERIPLQAFAYKKKGYATQMLGSYQPQNAALAVEVVMALRARGWSVSDEAVRKGIASTTWPGRFEVVSTQPTFIVDGGHNVQGAQALVDSLQACFPNTQPTFIIGVLEDKDYVEMLEVVMRNVGGAAYIAIAPPNPRALPAHKLVRSIRWTGQDILGCSACTNPYAARSIADGVRKALAITPEDGLIVAFGSLYSIAEIERTLVEEK